MPRRVIIVSALLCLLLTLAAGSARVQAQAPPAAAAVSPEEAVLSLLPFLLQPSDLPPGFELSGNAAQTPTGLAVSQATSNAGRNAALQQIQAQGLIAGVEQVILPNNVTPVRIFVAGVQLFTTPGLASAALKDELSVPDGRGVAGDNPALATRLGDESGALHVTVTRPDSNNFAIEEIAWRRGRLMFISLLEVRDATESLEQVTPLAAQADRRAAAATQPGQTTPRTLPAAGDEKYRLDAVLALGPRLPAADDAPLGFRSAGLTPISNADLVVAAPNARAMYDRIAGRWKRVVAVERRYDTLQGADGNVLRVGLALSVDAAGARASLADPAVHAGARLETYSLPAVLGDGGLLYRETYTSAGGVAHENWLAMWTRDRIVLSVSGDGPPGQITANDVAALAASADSRYLQGGVPDILTSPQPAEAPSPLPPPIA